MPNGSARAWRLRMVQWLCPQTNLSNPCVTRTRCILRVCRPVLPPATTSTTRQHAPPPTVTQAASASQGLLWKEISALRRPSALVITEERHSWKMRRSSWIAMNGEYLIHRFMWEVFPRYITMLSPYCCSITVHETVCRMSSKPYGLLLCSIFYIILPWAYICSEYTIWIFA